MKLTLFGLSEALSNSRFGNIYTIKLLFSILFYLLLFIIALCLLFLFFSFIDDNCCVFYLNLMHSGMYATFLFFLFPLISNCYSKNLVTYPLLCCFFLLLLFDFDFTSILLFLECIFLFVLFCHENILGTDSFRLFLLLF